MNHIYLHSKVNCFSELTLRLLWLVHDLDPHEEEGQLADDHDYRCEEDHE